MQQATFYQRDKCVNCRSANIKLVSEGRFSDPPLSQFIASDPWGENPAPFLCGATWRFVSCVDCGQRFHQNILTPEWNERRFSQWMSAQAIEKFEKRLQSASRDFLMGSSRVAHAIRLEKLTRHIRGADRLSVLDFGCGNGEFLDACRIFGFEAIGVDRSKARQEKNTVPVLASLDELPPTKKFHCISLFETLEHLEHPLELLTRLRGKIIDDGILILEVPDCTGVNGISSEYDYRKIDPLEHINAFVPSTLRSIAERAGFVSIRSPSAYVTDSLVVVTKRAIKPLVKPSQKATQQYFHAA